MRFHKSTPAPAATSALNARSPELLYRILSTYPTLSSLLQNSHRQPIINLARTCRAYHALLTTDIPALRSPFPLCDGKHRCFKCNVPLCNECQELHMIPSSGGSPDLLLENHEHPSTHRSLTTLFDWSVRFDRMKLTSLCGHCGMQRREAIDRSDAQRRRGYRHYRPFSDYCEECEREPVGGRY